MKKLTAIFAASAFVICTAATAGPGPTVIDALNNHGSSAPSVVKISDAVKTSFDKKFSRASNVAWQQTSDFYFAHFELNKDHLDAAYNEEGELLGMSRQITLAQLPLNIAQELAESYEGYTFNNIVTELIFDGQTNYYVNGEGKTSYVRLKCSPEGRIAVEKKIKKKVLVGRIL